VWNNLPIDALLDLLDEAAKVAILHIGLNENAQPAVLARDFTGPRAAPDGRDLPSGICFPEGEATSTSPRRSIWSRSSGPAAPGWKPLAAFNGRGDVLATQAGLHDVEHRLRAHP